MRCQAAEPLIALHVEQDLHEADRVRLESHLAGCEPCRLLMEDLRDSQAVFKRSFIGMVPPEHLPSSRVQEGVLARLSDPAVGDSWTAALAGALFGFRFGRRKALLAGLAVLWIGLGLWTALRERALDSGPVAESPAAGEDTAPVAAVPFPSEPLPAAAPAVEAVRRTPARKIPEASSPSAPVGTVESVGAQGGEPSGPVPDPALQAAAAVTDRPPKMVQFLTDDPNIIIYWLLEEQGE